MAQYNSKRFLVPSSPRTMASIHAKVENNIMKVTMHDCKGSIQLHNNLENKEEVEESLEKLQSLIDELTDIKSYIKKVYCK